jgi:hypothetical protein
MSNNRLFTGLCALGVGGPFLLVGLLATVQMLRLRANGILTRARVVSYESSADGESRYPVVEFHDQNGKVYQVQLAAAVATTSGGRVAIVYHRGNPRLARGIGCAHTWLVPFTGLIVGTGLVLLGILTLLGKTPEE